jgi:hypothetical protein
VANLLNRVDGTCVVLVNAEGQHSPLLQLELKLQLMKTDTESSKDAGGSTPGYSSTRFPC